MTVVKSHCHVGFLAKATTCGITYVIMDKQPKVRVGGMVVAAAFAPILITISCFPTPFHFFTDVVAQKHGIKAEPHNDVDHLLG